MTARETDDRRVRRTRRAIFDAFRELVLSRRYDEIRVGDIIEAADVGKSTFYEHFTNKDDVLLSSIEPLFEVLAEAATGDVVRERLFFVLSHFWDQRTVARVIFGPDLYFKLSRKLADMIEFRLGENNDAPQRLVAIERANAQLSAIRAWLAGEFQYDVESFAEYLAK
ncbi:MAG: TetR family transcriptional regulator [Marinicaulis sp.]|nr:TetR family transcriptional regulator [Marinicaulis sp.]